MIFIKNAGNVMLSAFFMRLLRNMEKCGRMAVWRNV